MVDMPKTMRDEDVVTELRPKTGLKASTPELISAETAATVRNERQIFMVVFKYKQAVEKEAVKATHSTHRASGQQRSVVSLPECARSRSCVRNAHHFNLAVTSSTQIMEKEILWSDISPRGRSDVTVTVSAA